MAPLPAYPASLPPSKPVRPRMGGKCRGCRGEILPGYLNLHLLGFGIFHTEGMDVVDAIAAVKTNMQDRPLTEQKIASITVETYGEEYPEPDKMKDPFGRF